jgi:hypothetical protein
MLFLNCNSVKSNTTEISLSDATIPGAFFDKDEDTDHFQLSCQ